MTAQRTFDQVREVYASLDRPAYDQAAEDFLTRLAAGASGRPRAQLALAVPDSVLAESADEVVAWWRRQDPLPATPRNERLVEHLSRVATAERLFGDESEVGVDARGETFVRYGRPARRVSVDVEADLFISQAIRAEPSIRRADFPENEVWWYPSLGGGVYFLFVERRGTYRRGDVLDLVPPALLAGGVGPALEPRARLLGQVLRWIAKTLYPFSDEFQNRLVDLDAVVDAEGRAFSGSTGLVIQSEVQRVRDSDGKDREVREGLPEAVTAVIPPAFGVDRQVAAFRDAPDGGPVVWASWGIDGRQLAATVDSLAGLGLAPDRYLVSTTAVAYDGSYEVTNRTDEGLSVLPSSGPTWLRVEGADAVAIQWSLVPASADGTPQPPGPVSAEVARLDLARTDVSLVSDLVVLDAQVVAGADDVDRLTTFAPPDPAGVVRPGEPVAVYFEVYGQPGDVVEIETRSVQSWRGMLFRPGREQQGATASEIVLDEWRYPVAALLTADAFEDADQLQILVTVRNVESGATAEREVTLRRE